MQRSLLMLILFWLLAATSQAAEPIDYARDIRPIFTNTCFKCHGPDAKKREAELRLDVAADALKDRDDGPAFKPGDLEASVAWQRLITTDEDELMPPADSKLVLTDKQKELVRLWIEQGAKFTEHWSYSRVDSPPVPKIKSSQPIANPIDAFVVNKLQQQHGLDISGLANRAALFRRVSLDLTGLPPALTDVEQYLNDKAPDAYEKAVDRLLASPAYGERWARVWLDLARYADSSGYAQDPPRTIWRYRDWVIRVINENKPFDQFTTEQLAGDLLPNPTQSQLIATAFHRNTMTNSEGGTDDEEFRNAAVIDRVNTTMQVWMGLTMECARCHSHKYDPVSQEEYFRFYAIFNNTEDSDKGDERPTIAFVSEEQEKQRIDLEKQIVNLTQERTKVQQDATPQQGLSKGPLKARYVRIENVGKGVFLSLAEVQILVGLENVALKGKATQVSTGFDGPAKLAIDGNTNGDYNAAKSVTHTEAADNPWWEVDLGSEHSLDQIVVWNRTDNGTGARLATFRIIGLNEKHEPVWVTQVNKPPTPSHKVAVPKTVEAISAQDRAHLATYTSGSSPATTAIDKQIAALKKQLVTLAGGKGAKTPIMRELPLGKQRKTFIQIRGNFKVKDKEVQVGLPSIFPKVPAGSEKIDRLTAARWLVDRDNPLTSRVIVNRYWEQVFGVGLVETSEDFGIQGALPSHPKLISWLAVDLMEHNWDIKRLLKQMVMSSTYRQTSRVTAARLEKDPKNRLLSRGPRFRLSAEMIRDQALAVSGLLSNKMYGPSVQPPRPVLGLRAAFGGSTDWKTSPGEDKYRRGLYTSWRRTTPYPSMTTFDAPSREVCTIRRIRTNTPLQAFVTMNDPVFVEASQALARRIIAEGGKTNEERATYGFRLCLAREPQPREKQRLVALYEEVLARYAKDEAAAKQMATEPLGAAPTDVKITELAAWTVVSNILINLDEFLARR